ncbi:aminotransferase class I/II-fold pyridoxal phosphate-dependent enzyme [Enterobacter hormaechei]|nr:aminotransferase class I/II-fold pyridoxal phosphate-dependent enzyme [Enterobacter hormaechei]
MKKNNLVRTVIYELPELSPLSHGVSNHQHTHHDNLLPYNGKWREYPCIDTSEISSNIINAWGKIEGSKGFNLELHDENVLITNGCVDALMLSMTLFCEPKVDSIAIYPPTFEAFSYWATLQGVGVHEIKGNLTNELSLLNPKLTILCSPNNPTGYMFSRNEIINLLRSSNGGLIIDETYADFSNKESAMSLVNDFENLVVIRSLSKSFGLAGLRLGSMIASESIIQASRKVQVPFSISSPVRNEVNLALNNIDLIIDNIDKIRTECRRFMHELKTCPCVSFVYESDANFIFVKWNDPVKVQDFLCSNGFSVKNTLYGTRITVSTQNENDFFISKLKECI